MTKGFLMLMANNFSTIIDKKKARQLSRTWKLRQKTTQTKSIV